MKVLVFGSRNLTARHLDAMVEKLRAIAAVVPAEERLVLIHGAGPFGTTPGAIGADRLSEVAAHLAWSGRDRGVRRYPVMQAPDESWGRAAIRRDRQMAERTLDRAVCFHTDPNLGKGSACTAACLTRLGKPYTLVLLGGDGRVLQEEER